MGTYWKKAAQSFLIDAGWKVNDCLIENHETHETHERTCKEKNTLHR